MKAQFFTDQGQIRNHNEDAGGIAYNQKDQMLAVVADGMGGHQAGDVASEMATSIIRDKWTDNHEVTSPEETEAWLQEALYDINSTIFDKSKRKKECQGMGTTIVTAICTNDFVTVSHIGDSRCYLLNSDGFKQVTEDHSLVNELVRTGQIDKDDAEQHPRKNVLLKAVGTEESIAADTQSLEWGTGNKLLLCSDGLTNKVSDEELLEYVQSDQEPAEAGKELIQLANERGGEDNISLIIVHHDFLEKEGDS